ncbi:hypothetical protein EC100833_1097, partial [Escherichia coli 10.0833]
SHR